MTNLLNTTHPSGPVGLSKVADQNEINRIQSFLRENARKLYNSVPNAPFTIFFHPTDANPYFNYAIPDQAIESDPVESLAELRVKFTDANRIARFEFLEAFSPHLPDILTRHGFIEEARQWSMVCIPQSFRHAPVVPDLQTTWLTSDSAETDIRDFIVTQRAGFNGNEIEQELLPDQGTIQQMRHNLAQGWHALLGRVNGQPAGVAVFSSVIQSMSEVAGIATLPGYRRRGIASFLTALAVQAAFEHGAKTICLTAEDERAGRVYEGIGFKPFSIMLAYRDIQ